MKNALPASVKRRLRLATCLDRRVLLRCKAAASQPSGEIGEIDIAVVDLSMPGMPGLDPVKRITSESLIASAAGQGKA